MNKPVVDPSEAPAGYYAVSKHDVKTACLGNICRACDWRLTCQKDDTDFTLHNHRCMETPVISAVSGVVVARADGCSVVFKQIPASAI